MPSDHRVREAMQELAQTLSSRTPLPDALMVVTRGAVDAIEAADHASISLRHRDGRLETLAATDPLIEDVDARQYELGEGPCYESVSNGVSFLVSEDVAHDPRWPRFGPVAAQAGLRAQAAAFLATNGSKTRSALNLYSRQPHRFDADSIATAEMFASHASVAMGFVHTIDNLSQAITARQMVGQAVGIIMERYHLDEQRAFDFLVRTSSQTNVKLRTIAADLITNSNRLNAPQASAHRQG